MTGAGNQRALIRSASGSRLFASILLAAMASWLMTPLAVDGAIIVTPSPAAALQDSTITLQASVQDPGGEGPEQCYIEPYYPPGPFVTFPCAWTWTASGGGVVSGAIYPTPTAGSATFSVGTTPGQYTVTVSRFGEPSSSVAVTVSPMTIAVSGPQSVAQNDSAEYAATVSGIVQGATGIAWSSIPAAGIALTPNGSTVTVTAGSFAGLYALVATSTLEPSVSATFDVTVLPPPVTTITPASVVTAAGQYTPFSASVANQPDQSVSWYTNDPEGGVNATGNGNTVQYFHSPGSPGGQFYVQAQSFHGGAPAIAPVSVVTVTVAPAAITVPPGSSRQFLAEVTASQQATLWVTTVPGATISGGGLLQVPASTPAGSYSVTVQAVGSPLATAAATVTVATVVPVTAVVVSPARSVLDSGQQEPFTAVVEGQNAEPNPNQAVSWSVSGPAPAAIAANGLFTAPAAPGIYTVTAASVADATKSATAAVTVGEDLMILPPSASLAPGASQLFQAQVSGVASPVVAWSVEEGAGGGAISPAGLYMAPPEPGAYHVLAISSDEGGAVQGIATVIVSANPQISIVVSPRESAITAGGTQQFTATVDGSADTGVTWSASAGAIDQTGLFTAPSAYGTVTITAASHANPQVQASATAVVSIAGQGQPFQYDANGNLLADGTRTYEWDAENRLTAVSIGTHRGEFGYDGLGRRVLITEKDNGTVTTSRHYIWDGDQLAEETDATTAPSAGAPPIGSFDSLDCNQLIGWAWSATQPDTPIAVDVYDGSTKIASVLANAYRGDLRAAGAGNGDHGFFFPTPAALKTGTQHSVTVTLGGTSASLGTRAVTCAVPSFAGSFGEADCTQLAGWAWDANQPSSPISVDIYDGATLLTTVLANAFRQDLLSSGFGNGDHGFFLPTPASLKNGAAHAISLKIAGTSTVVGGTRTMTCAAPSFSGNLDGADCTQLYGWAWDANQPNAALNVDIYDGTTLLATVAASTFRQDLKNAGLGNGDHGFTYSSSSLYTGSTHSISVHYGGTTTPLAETPRSITCPSETILTRFFPRGMQSGPTSYYFSYDHLGSVREVTDGGGNVVSRYDYDPYGRLTINQGTPPRFGFAGYYYHQPSGLSLTKYRAYDPDLGRWESRDPIGEVGGANLYSFVANDPVDRVDPLGLEWKGGRTPNKLWPPLPESLGGRNPTWNKDGYWEGKNGEGWHWDDRSHGSGADRGNGPQDGHWDNNGKGKAKKRCDRNGNPLFEAVPLPAWLLSPIMIQTANMLAAQAISGAQQISNLSNWLENVPSELRDIQSPPGPVLPPLMPSPWFLVLP
jgi:RHS repeat-associated protein